MPVEQYRDLMELAGGNVFARGLSYYHEGRVTLGYVDENADEVQAEVVGSYDNFYQVSIWFYNTAWDEIMESVCDCPAYDPSTGMCKHVVAAVLAARAYKDPALREEVPVKGNEAPRPAKAKKQEQCISDRAALGLITYYAQMIADESHPRPPITELARLEAVLFYERERHYWGEDEIYLTLKVGAKRLYVVKDVQDFAEGFTNHAVLKMGKNYSVLLDRDAFEPECRPLVDFIRECASAPSPRPYYSAQKKALYLSRAALDEYLEMSAGGTITLSRYKGRQRSLQVRQAAPPLTLALREEAPGYSLSCSSFDGLLQGSRFWYLIKNTVLYRCDEEFSRTCHPLLEALETGEQFIAPKDMPALLSSVIARIKPHFDVSLPESAYRFMPEPLEVSIYFDLDEHEGISARMDFRYGDSTFPAFASKRSTQSLDLPSEMRAEHCLVRYMGEDLVAEGTLAQRDEGAIYALLSEGFDELRGFAEVFVTEAFNRIRIHPPVQVQVGIRVEGRLLDVSLDLEGIGLDELAQVLNSYRKLRRYHRLRDGSFLDLSDDSLGRVAELGEALDLQDASLLEGRFTVDVNRSLYLDALLKQNEQVRYERDGSFKEIVSRMRDVEDSDYELPAPLRGTLRNYQETGYQWLRTLHGFGFGGVLADDMGLGKTLQVLALFQALKDEGRGGPSIVVCPASLVYNWQAEACRFTPGLSVCAIAGTAAQRAAAIAEAHAYDLVVTSYDLLKRDIELYAPVRFSYAVLDEAQYIKNQNTQSAKAAKLLGAMSRLALTGTPIENSLAELWSVFDFLMPGYLGNYHRFRQKFETPVTKQKNEAATERLRALVRPFIMRRLKGDVLKELPAKIEQVHIAEMDVKQRKLYLATLAQTKKDLRKQLKEAGAAQSRILVLAALTRLRQICCDPALVYENYDGESAKLQMFMELVGSSLGGGHRVVVFSQFTSMLALIREQLEAAGIGYYLLQGSTPKMERLKLVEQFNANDVPVFLVSLKAGGTGLNLIGADVVIHYDPWWNISAQNQATDRTHRIGQTKRVQVFKLVMKDSIEEKILELQAAKAELADRVIQKGEAAFDTLTSEELVDLLSESFD